MCFFRGREDIKNIYNKQIIRYIGLTLVGKETIFSYICMIEKLLG